ncbi:hypothetical protein J3R30DRAFT_3440465 [Lentinula aciculospora]|uniref:Mid2 domain-containing protein n=1 Tax=Lentinula aciculospora TaxID=153920 RepID=A0A9W9ALZ9_9AGAR|nr:hypothetical protein J3R30DRAFT_3440465 [Lentinula aciculospora]
MSAGSFINQTFDDRDTTDLHYAGAWPSPQTGSWNATNVGESGTLSSTEDIRANVTFIFSIPANAVYYYGIPRCCGGLYAICLDCDPNNPIFEMIDAVNTTDDGKNPPVVLWSKTFDTTGIHEILLTNQNDSRFGHSQITLDRFDLQVSNTAPVVTSFISEAPSSPATSPATSFAPLATSSVSAIAQSKPSVPEGAIIGAIIGAIVGVTGLIVILMVWIFWRRQRRSRALDDQGLRMAQTPFYTHSVAPPGVGPYIITDNTSKSISSINTSKRRAPHLSDVYTPVASSSSASPARPRREIDAGQIPHDLSDGETLPPEYDQIFRRAAQNVPPMSSENLASFDLLRGKS